MTNIAAIFRRELAGYFAHPLAYIVLALFVALLGVFSLGFNDILTSHVASMRVPFFWTAACFLFLAPAVTMRLIAEERRTGSLEMLTTLPVTVFQIIFGKWLAAVALVAVGLFLTLTYPVAIASLGDLDWGPVAGGYVGLLLMGASFAAIGIAASSLTENQVVAFLFALSICLLPWMVGFFLPMVPAEWVVWVQYLSFEYHFANLAKGVLDSRSIVFYVSVIAVALRIAMLSLEQRSLT